MSEPGDDIYGSPEHRAFRETVRRFVQSSSCRGRASSTTWAASYVARMLRL